METEVLKKRSFREHLDLPVSWDDLVILCFLAYFIFSPLRSLGSFISDYASDSYHISKVEYFVSQAVSIKNHPHLSQQQKSSLSQTALSHAQEHNLKIRRRVASSVSAIEGLNILSLRGYKGEKDVACEQYGSFKKVIEPIALEGGSS